MYTFFFPISSNYEIHSSKIVTDSKGRDSLEVISFSKNFETGDSHTIFPFQEKVVNNIYLLSNGYISIKQIWSDYKLFSDEHLIAGGIIDSLDFPEDGFKEDLIFSNPEDNIFENPWKRVPLLPIDQISEDKIHELKTLLEMGQSEEDLYEELSLRAGHDYLRIKEVETIYKFIPHLEDQECYESSPIIYEQELKYNYWSDTVITVTGNWDINPEYFHDLQLVINDTTLEPDSYTSLTFDPNDGFYTISAKLNPDINVNKQMKITVQGIDANGEVQIGCTLEKMEQEIKKYKRSSRS